MKGFERLDPEPIKKIREYVYVLQLEKHYFRLPTRNKLQLEYLAYFELLFKTVFKI
jgi:hypothetical protein